MTLEQALNDYEPFFRTLVKHPVKPIEGLENIKINWTQQEAIDFYEDLRFKFIELFYEYEEGKTKFSSYIGSKLGWYAHNQAMKRLKEKSMEVDILDEHLEEFEYISPEPSPIYKELDKVKEVLPFLTEIQQKVIDYKYFEQKSYTEIATLLGMSREGVNVHRKKAIKRIKKLLED